MNLRENEINTDIENILELYAADIEEVETEVKLLIEMIDGTHQFVDAHLDTVRNELMKITLVIEIFALVLGFGAVVGGFFGMNMNNHINEHNGIAFPLVVTITLLAMSLIAGVFWKIYYHLKQDTSSAQTFTLLKNFFTYVDEFENIFAKNKKVDKRIFKEALQDITNSNVGEKELDYLFQMIDADNDGVIDGETEMNIETCDSDFSIDKNFV